jgi:hypothetical protein
MSEKSKDDLEIFYYLFVIGRSHRETALLDHSSFIIGLSPTPSECLT